MKKYVATIHFQSEKEVSTLEEFLNGATYDVTVDVTDFHVQRTDETQSRQDYEANLYTS